jgi:hypothetical protein
MEAQRREIPETRFTSLDRLIVRRAVGDDPEYFHVTANPDGQDLQGTARVRERHLVGRLGVLESRGLKTATNTWRVRRDCESVLRAMQRATDHQKTLASHGVLASDDRLPIHVLRWHEYPGGVQGRVLIHGQEEISGRNYLMLEGTDAAIHFVYYTSEMEAARSQGALRTNSFIKLRRLTGINGESMLDISELGDADAVLKSRRHFEAEAQQLVKRGIIPDEDGPVPERGCGPYCAIAIEAWLLNASTVEISTLTALPVAAPCGIVTFNW